MQTHEMVAGPFRARLGTFGASLLSLEAPDRDGRAANVVLGFDDPAAYTGPHPYFGATVGRFANRIAHGRLEIDGVAYALPCNHGAHHLHGGPGGFGRVDWSAEPSERSVRFVLVSPDGDQGYPGRLEASVTYALSEPGDLRIDFRARTDRPTVVNLSHHSYFNLSGDPRARILDHELSIEADAYLPVDEEAIPSGVIQPVEGTPFDFRKRRPIESAYDHCFVLRPDDGLRKAASVYEPRSGRTLEVRTTQPGLQLYTGGFLHGTPHARFTGLCLETQGFPDAPNHPAFPSTVLRPGEEYTETVVYRFGCVP